MCRYLGKTVVVNEQQKRTYEREMASIHREQNRHNGKERRERKYKKKNQQGKRKIKESGESNSLQQQQQLAAGDERKKERVKVNASEKTRTGGETERRRIGERSRAGIGGDDTSRRRLRLALLCALCRVLCAVPCCRTMAQPDASQPGGTLDIEEAEKRSREEEKDDAAVCPGSRSGYRYRPSGRMKQDSREPGGRSQVLFLAWSHVQASLAARQPRT